MPYFPDIAIGAHYIKKMHIPVVYAFAFKQRLVNSVMNEIQKYYNEQKSEHGIAAIKYISI